MKDWRKRFGAPPLSWNVLELSGDTHHDQSTLERADVRIVIFRYIFISYCKLSFFRNLDSCLYTRKVGSCFEGLARC